MKVKTIPTLMLLSGLLGSIVATVARPHQQEKADQLSEDEAVGLVRTINTAQVGFESYSNPRRYASLKELIVMLDENSGKEQQVVYGANSFKELQLIDGSTGRLKNYTVSVVASTDGQHYILELINRSNCDSSFFSSDTGIIYTGTGLGCADEKASKNN